MARLPRHPFRAARSIRGALLVPCLAAVPLLSGCANRVWMMVPPKVDLGEFERIGLIEFECSDPALQRRATDRFQEMILEARPGSHVLEIVGSIRPEDLDPDTVRALAEEHGLDALFVGTLEFSELTPTIGVATSLVEINARAEIIGTMSARLIEPGAGSTVWIRSVDERVTVASGGIASDGTGSLEATDPSGTHSALLRDLAVQITNDFRAQYFRKKRKEVPPHYEVTYPDGVEVYAPPRR